MKACGLLVRTYPCLLPLMCHSIFQFGTKNFLSPSSYHQRRENSEMQSTYIIKAAHVIAEPIFPPAGALNSLIAGVRIDLFLHFTPPGAARNTGLFTKQSQKLRFHLQGQTASVRSIRRKQADVVLDHLIGTAFGLIHVTPIITRNHFHRVISDACHKVIQNERQGAIELT